jgi:hypothetical protein
MNKEYVFWTFSAAAQSLSAFIALVLAGYALVHNIMESVKEKDDSLEEVHALLLRSFHKNMTLLVWVSGLAIIMDLMIVYVNGLISTIPWWFQGIVGLINCASIIGGAAFVVKIVDPIKYKKIARETLSHYETIKESNTDTVTAQDFMSTFIKLEKLIRDYFNRRPDYAQDNTINKRYKRAYSSLREMIDELVQMEVINSELRKELFNIISYRNLVFHGQVDSVEKSQLMNLEIVLNDLKCELDKGDEK